MFYILYFILYSILQLRVSYFTIPVSKKKKKKKKERERENNLNILHFQNFK